MNTVLKNDILRTLARLVAENKAAIIDANSLDVDSCPKGDAVILDRLKVDDAKVEKMVASIERVISQRDTDGELISSHTRADGLRIENRRVPFGTILIIYEARPDVSIEAAMIALKAGNRILLKGGREARQTNLFLAGLWRQALAENDADTDFVRYLDLSRDETMELIRGGGDRFDLVIPRGGESLIDFVVKNSAVPVIVSGRGNNFLYIDAEADFEMALAIAIDGKRRLSVCNALDKILIHEGIEDLPTRVARLARAFRESDIEIFGDQSVCEMDPSVAPLTDDRVWYEEFLAPKIVIGLVRDASEAVAKINKYSGGHSAAIITENGETARMFLRDADCAAVYHNASVRFTDGGEFGLGAEIAISTQKLHFRGPLGAEHLLTNKWFVFGDGHCRN